MKNLDRDSYRSRNDYRNNGRSGEDVSFQRHRKKNDELGKSAGGSESAYSRTYSDEKSISIRDDYRRGYHDDRDDKRYRYQPRDSQQDRYPSHERDVRGSRDGRRLRDDYNDRYDSRSEGSSRQLRSPYRARDSSPSHDSSYRDSRRVNSSYRDAKRSYSDRFGDPRDYDRGEVRRSPSTSSSHASRRSSRDSLPLPTKIDSFSGDPESKKVKIITGNGDDDIRDDDSSVAKRKFVENNDDNNDDDDDDFDDSLIEDEDEDEDEAFFGGQESIAEEIEAARLRHEKYISVIQNTLLPEIENDETSIESTPASIEQQQQQQQQQKTPPPAPPAPQPEEQLPKVVRAAVDDDDDFDLFDASDDELVGSDLTNTVVVASRDRTADPSLQFNFDDSEGYYLHNIGEVIHEKYRVLAELGRGVFSTVLRAAVIGSDSDHVAIKVMRNNETMRRAGQKEAQMMKIMDKNDSPGSSCVIRWIDTLDWRNHLCLVFEELDVNLREVLKMFGKDVGLSLEAVRQYAKQTLLGLLHMKKSGILHSDIKLDNILVSKDRFRVKIGDFGSAFPAEEQSITPYLVSRFYRAPEIVLGLKYDYAIDLWSLGCCLAELFTGKILFPGKSNNEMLKMFQDSKGAFSRKMIRRSVFRDQHFNSEFVFQVHSVDPVTFEPRVHSEFYQPDVPKKSLKTLLEESQKDVDMSLPEIKRMARFCDLLNSMLKLDPSKRISVERALEHKFFADD